MAQIPSELTKLVRHILIESDMDVKFASFSFPNNDKKLKCAIPLLSGVSQVFNRMFSKDWYKGDKTIKMNDLLSGYDKFDQYNTFKLFLHILNGLRDLQSLTFSELVEVLFYSNKYQVDIMNDAILDYIKLEIGKRSPSTTELKDVLYFVQLFDLDELKNGLDVIKLSLTDENCCEYYELAKGHDLVAMKLQIIDYCGTIKPNEKWTPQLLCLVMENLQEKLKQERKNNHLKRRRNTDNNSELLYQGFEPDYDFGLHVAPNMYMNNRMIPFQLTVPRNG